ncbi:MAG TPA: VWA domain-containing protein [Pyrinomonadaceae bacterium]|nr:VWA domain-containing protein [Pyrinomonadaceae bacterium]
MLRQDRTAMPYLTSPATVSVRKHFQKGFFCFIAVLFALAPVSAQTYHHEVETGDKPSVYVKSRNGRISVIATDDEQKKVTIEASSAGALVDQSDVLTVAKGGEVSITVRDRREKDRIDLVVHVPSRAKVKIESEAGAVDVVGNLESAQVSTNTGTIHADVPLDAVKFNFIWSASRPRFLSDVELPKVKERAAGMFTISGKLGEKKPDKAERVQLDFLTQRGVVLLNVDPAMVPPDLRERPLTEAARAIVRSGDSQLTDAIRKVSPKMFGDYAMTLPPPEKQPELVKRSAPGQFVSALSPQLMRFNASVMDRNGRAIGGMKETDFTVFENGVEREVKQVTPTNEPFNLILLLDVSGSVEERIDFIRKAARDFLNTASPQDRIAIISFRDDIQVISDFTTDRRLLSKKLEDIDAGGATALYDALGYVLADPVKKLRGERTAIVILSDGDDNRSFVPFPAILEALVESGALIYPLYIPSGLIPEGSVPKPEVTIDPLRTRYLTLTTRAEEEGKKLAAGSGGVYYPIHRLEDLQRAYDDVVVQLRTAYTITYASNSRSSSNPRVRVRANRDGASVRLSPVVNVATP